jgi:hypothetical protein
MSIPHMAHERIWNSGGMILTEKTEGLGEKPALSAVHHKSHMD